ncbi:helix-turn-helix domain-containing protein [Eggerthella sp. NSJ-70]|uniref:Helix-turn-helix domain-containing protein n=1 Tax=Eggerthella hominis TaxID=2763043 RepID=A0ABR7BQ06_9ACTN|nr:helix-turn-helix domain-containing protein [Eggerthella hominis]MBC5583688.1 helix-turn-helix domain-containing protein [Eggerthella hominis]
MYENGKGAEIEETERNRVIEEVSSARKASGLSQNQLEEAAGVRQPVIARLEKGDTAPRLDTLIKVLAPLGKTLRVVDLTETAGESGLLKTVQADSR